MRDEDQKQCTTSSSAIKEYTAITSHRYHLHLRACQPLRPTQPPTLSGTENEYWSRDSGMLCGWEGNPSLQARVTDCGISINQSIIYLF